MKTIKWIITALLVTPAITMAAESNLDDWYIGFGIGPGSAYYEDDGDKITFKEWFAGADNYSHASVNIKSGWRTSNPNVLVGIDFTGASSTGTIPGTTARLALSNLFVVGTWFPAGPHFFVRGGGGLSTIVQEVNNSEWRARGVGVLLGAGYYWRLRESFGLSVNLDFVRSTFSGGNDPDAAGATLFYLGFDWY